MDDSLEDIFIKAYYILHFCSHIHQCCTLQKIWQWESCQNQKTYLLHTHLSQVFLLKSQILYFWLSLTFEQWAESRVRSQRTAQMCELQPFSGHMLVNAQVQTIEELFGDGFNIKTISLARAVGLHGRLIATMIKISYTHNSEVMKFSFSLFPRNAVCFLFIL